MPVKFSQATGFQLHDCGSEGSGYGEIAGVNYLQGSATTGDGGSGFLRKMVDVRTVALEFSVGAGCVWGADGAVDDIGVRSGNAFEDGLVDTEILGEDRFGGVGNPVIKVKGCSIWVVRAFFGFLEERFKRLSKIASDSASIGGA